MQTRTKIKYTILLVAIASGAILYDIFVFPMVNSRAFSVVALSIIILPIIWIDFNFNGKNINLIKLIPIDDNGLTIGGEIELSAADCEKLKMLLKGRITIYEGADIFRYGSFLLRLQKKYGHRDIFPDNNKRNVMRYGRHGLYLKVPVENMSKIDEVLRRYRHD